MPWNFMNCWSSSLNRSMVGSAFAAFIVCARVPASVGIAVLISSLWVNFLAAGAAAASVLMNVKDGNLLEMVGQQGGTQSCWRVNDAIMAWIWREARGIYQKVYGGDRLSIFLLCGLGFMVFDGANE